MKNKICFVAGHSGGHIIPCVTQAKKELDKNQNLEILFFCTNSSLDNKILNNYNFINNKVNLEVCSLSKNPIKLLKFFWYFTKAFISSALILRKFKPEKIVSMGGLVSIPVVLAGKLLGIKSELWELNVEPGKTITFLSKFVKEVNICFDETSQYLKNIKCNIVEYPVRFNHLSKSLQKNEIIEKLGFECNRKTILIIGGSQGSMQLNNLFKEWIEQNINLHDTVQIIHQTGNNEFNWKEYYNNYHIPAITFAFYDKMDEYYSIADLIICRSGAGTLAEVLFFQKKCITIPLKTKTTSHQILNAKSLEKKYPNLFSVIDRTDENKQLLFNKINKEITY